MKALRTGTSGCDFCGWEKIYESSRQKTFKILEHYGHKLLSGDPKTKLESIFIRCPRGHTFPTKVEYLIKAYALNSKAGACKTCQNLIHSEKAKEKFLEELRTEGYEPLEEYTTAKTKIKIRRVSDGETNYISAADWKQGRRWLKPPSIRLDELAMQKFLDERKPGYRLVDASTYRSKYDEVIVECDGDNDKKEKHIYKAQWQIIQYYKCRKCAGGHQSGEEIEFRKKLEEVLDLKCQTQYLIPGTRKSLDMVFLDQKIAIEYCGLWFHSSEFKKPSDHLHKLKLANSVGFRLITVFEDEWKQKQEVVLSKIKSIFKKYTKIIYARNCQIKEITKQEARGFFNDNHLQGYTAQKVCFGLFYKEDLIGAMSFGSFTRSKPDETSSLLELKRLAFSKNTLVIGGASRLLKAGEMWAKQKNFKTLVSFADLRWSAGEVYRTLGFSLKSKYIRPSKHYYKNRIRWNAQSLKLKPEERSLGITERQLRAEQGYRTIYDCGHQRWEKSL